MVKAFTWPVFIYLIFIFSSANALNTYDENATAVFEKLSVSGISFHSFQNGYKGYKAICDSLGTRYRYLCIADFTLPSTEKRMYVIDMQDTSLLHRDYVAHGRNTGGLMAASFSNEVHSLQSSLGFYVVAETYSGKHGLSIRLDGIDAGFNDQARNRAVVMHTADYAEPEFIAVNGRLGRSQGCPVLPMDGFQKIAPLIPGNALLFIYYPQETYLSSSKWLQPRFSAQKSPAESTENLISNR